MEKKRAPCKFFMNGLCKKGEECTFSHEGGGMGMTPHTGGGGYQHKPRNDHYNYQPQHSFPIPRYNQRPRMEYPPMQQQYTPAKQLCFKYSTDQYCSNSDCKFVHQYSYNNLINRSKFLTVPSKSLSGMCIYNQSKLFISSADPQGNLYQYNPDMNPNNMQKMMLNFAIGARLPFKLFLICAVSSVALPKAFGLIIFNEKGEQQSILGHENDITDLQIFSEEKNLFLSSSYDMTVNVWNLEGPGWKICQNIVVGVPICSLCCFDDKFAAGDIYGNVYIYVLGAGFQPFQKISLNSNPSQKFIVSGLAFDKLQGLLACSAGSGVFIINIENSLFTPFQIPWKSIGKIELTCLAICEIKIGTAVEKLIITGDMKGKIKIRSLKAGIKEIDNLNAHKSAVRKILVLKNKIPNSFFSLGLEDTLSLWDFQNSEDPSTILASQQASEDYANDAEMN